MEENIIQKVMPQSTEAEQSVIGCMLTDSSSISSISEILSPEDFYNQQYRVFFECMTELYESGSPADLITLQNRLREKNVPAEYTDASYIGNFITSVYTTENAEEYAKIVKNKSILRSLIHASEGIAGRCYADDDDLENILNHAESSIFKVTQTRGISEFEPIGKIALKAFKSIQAAAKNGGHVTGLSTGFIDLDYRTAGFQPSDLILIAARPSMGKTAFALNIAENMAVRSDTAVAFFSLEMSSDQLIKRLLSMNSGIDSQKIRTGQLQAEDWLKTTESLKNISESRIFIDDTPGISIHELRSKCRRLKAEHGLGIVMIDYLQLMTAGRRVESRQHEISEISRSLKALARELDCPVVALSQLSRSVEHRDNKRPMLSDLRESGAIEQDADVVMFLYRDEYYHPDSEKKGVTELIIGKQRNGPTCTVELAWLAQYTKFANLQHDHGRNS